MYGNEDRGLGLIYKDRKQQEEEKQRKDRGDMISIFLRCTPFFSSISSDLYSQDILCNVHRVESP